MTTLKRHYLFFLILTFAAIIFSVNLNKPFFGHHDWNGAWYSNFARNFTMYGFLETKFGSVMNIQQTQPSNFQYFTHYPPLLPILIAISFKTFGQGEWQARLIPFLFSLFTITMIYTLGLKFFNIKVANLAAIISAVLPITIYFGKMPVQEVLVIGPVLLSIYFYFDFFKASTKKNIVKLILSLVLAHLINWPGYYVTPLFFLHFLLFSKSQSKFIIGSIFPLISLAMFALHSIHTAFLTGNMLGGGMFDVLLFRLNISDPPLGYSTFNFIKLQIHLTIAYFTKPVIFFSTLSVLWMILKMKDIRKSQKLQLLLILFAFGITHNLVFRNMAYIHDYMIIYLWPFIAISASFGFFLAMERFKKTTLIHFVLSAILVTSITVSGFSFTKALLSSQGFKEGYELGMIINKNTQSSDKVLVLSEQFKEHFEVFVNYYSARAVTYDINPTQQLQEESKLIVAIPQRDTPPSLIEVLQKEYKETKIGEFIIFNLDERQTTSFDNYSHL